MVLAPAVLLVRPACFGFNAEAAATNRFARAEATPGVAARARGELDQAAERIRAAGVRVIVAEDSPDPPKPDAVFPNNWVSFPPGGGTVLYPMAPPSRRAERRDAVVELARGVGWRRRLLDLTGLEASGGFLEGTGSLVLDHDARSGFAARSPRTTEAGIAAFEAKTGYRILRFESALDGVAIYHTNVMLALGPAVALVGTSLVGGGREPLLEHLAASGRRILELEGAQVAGFAANVLWLAGPDGPVVVMSRRAEAALTRDQLVAMGPRVVVDIPTIEDVGGGSARCLLAEVFAAGPPATPRAQTGDDRPG